MKKIISALVLVGLAVAAFGKSYKVQGVETTKIERSWAAEKDEVIKVLFLDGYSYLTAGSKTVITITNHNYKFEYDEVKEKKRAKVEKKMLEELAEIKKNNLEQEELRAKLTENQINARAIATDINHSGYYTDNLQSISFDESWNIEFKDFEGLEELTKKNYKVELKLASRLEGLDIEGMWTGITIYWDTENESFYVLNYLQSED